MNPTQSALQQKYPLSPKKYWKKMLTQIIGIVLVDLVLGGAAGAGIVAGLGALKWLPETSVATNVLIAVLYFIAIIAIHTGLYSWYVKVYIRRYFYDGEENFITIKKGVFAPTEIHVQWQKIQDVYVDQDILDRIMGLYDVHIASATAASGIEAHIDGVEKDAAEGLKKFLLDKVSGKGHVGASVGTQPLQASSAIAQNATTKMSAQGKIHLNQEISDKKFPLTDKWIKLTLVTRILSSFVIAAAAILIFGQKTDLMLWSTIWSLTIYIWLALSVVIIVFRTVALFLWKKNYAFNFTPEHIYFRNGVISISEKHMPYSAIQDVTVRQGIIDRFFGLASVVIENAAQVQVVQTRNGRQPVGFAGILLQGLSFADAKTITDVLKTAVLGHTSSKHGL